MSALYASASAWLSGVTAGFNSDLATELFDGYKDGIAYVVVLYALLVALGPQLLERLRHCPAESADDVARRDAVFAGRVRLAMRCWNALLAGFSALGAVSAFHLMGYLLRTRTFYQMTCELDYFSCYDGRHAFWVFSFMLSKIPEMMDTVFLILQRKPVIFLHSYHHLTVAVFCWYAGRAFYPPGILFVAMNYCVHALMYAYFLASSFAALRPITRAVAPLVTALQILQMVAGFAVCVYVSYYTFLHRYPPEGVVNTRGRVVHGCEADRRVTRMGLLMYGSYFGLFVAFFVRKYTRRAREKGGQAGKGEGTDMSVAHRSNNGIGSSSSDSSNATRSGAAGRGGAGAVEKPAAAAAAAGSSTVSRPNG